MCVFFLVFLFVFIIKKKISLLQSNNISKITENEEKLSEKMIVAANIKVIDQVNK